MCVCEKHSMRTNGAEVSCVERNVNRSWKTCCRWNVEFRVDGRHNCFSLLTRFTRVYLSKRAALEPAVLCTFRTFNRMLAIECSVEHARRILPANFQAHFSSFLSIRLYRFLLIKSRATRESDRVKKNRFLARKRPTLSVRWNIYKYLYKYSRGESVLEQAYIYLCTNVKNIFSDEEIRDFLKTLGQIWFPSWEHNYSFDHFYPDIWIKEFTFKWTRVVSARQINIYQVSDVFSLNVT